MTIAQRIGASLLSIILAVFISGLCISIANPVTKADWVRSVLVIFFYSSPFCVVGWLLSLPIILSIRRTDKWRFWALLVLGSSIGPLIMFSITMYFEVSAVITRSPAPHWDAGVKNWIYIAISISCLTTLIYLFLVRRIENNRQPTITESA